MLLLGLLLSHEMHGYQIHELLNDNPIIPISLKKSNAYRLLRKMEEKGWVTHKNEQSGNRPQKRVYSITENGAKAFYKLLRTNIASFPSPEFPAAVCFDFLHLLPTEEVISLFTKRLSILQSKMVEIENLPPEIKQSHLAADYVNEYYKNEIKWLNGVIDRLKNQE